MENNEEILKKINSGEDEKIAEAVREIQENGDLTIAGMLIDNLGQIQDQHLVTVIVNLLADIKDNNFKPLLIKQIRNTSIPQIKTELIQITWESSLDYSPYLDVFLDLLQQDDFLVAFEASCAIENMVRNLDAGQQASIRTAYQSSTLTEENRELLFKNILEALQENI